MKTFQLELITPCFCAGADQSRAEIRPPSIRGQLRWWFRALGGSRAHEDLVFGSTSGDTGRASAVQVRSNVISLGPQWKPPKVDPNNPNAYVYYFASVSGKQRGQKGPGPRWTEQGNIPPGTQIELRLSWLRGLSGEVTEMATTAVRMWLYLGGMGMRVTRGLGAFQCREYPLTEAALQWIKDTLPTKGFGFKVWKRGLERWQEAVQEAGRVLKEQLRPRFPAGKNGEKQSPLGSSHPRQTSAVYLRPVKFADESYGLVLFEAPAARVLGRASRRGAPALRALGN